MTQINSYILTANRLKSKDDDMKGVIIALDAKKAFDSVDHNFIKKTLTKIGLEDFISTFELLYNQQRVDIDFNGEIVQGYQIKNGVKQGDALSCIIFILVMEPLMRNLEINNRIKNLQSRIYQITLPKCLGYADDITVICKDDILSIREIFKEYEQFTIASGLELNADKTEIFKVK